MPTAQSPRGATVEIYHKEQTDFKTAATGNYSRTLAYSYGLTEAKPFEQDPLLGLTKHNTRDQTEPGPGLAELSGDVVVPLDFGHLGYWLKTGLGAPQTSGSDPNYTHVFASGAVALTERTIERKLVASGGNIFIQHVGVFVNSIAIQASRQAGYGRLTLGCSGYAENNLGASSGAGTPAALVARDPIAAALGIYKIDTVQAAVLEVNATYNNNLAMRDETGDARISGFDIDEATLTGTIRLRFRNSTLYDAAIAGTSHAGEILFQKSANRSLSWAMPVVRLERTGVPTEGPGGIEQTFNLRAEQTDAAAMLTVTLKGGVATY